MNSISPIVISTYIRLEHLKKTISALQVNSLADKSHLFILSDAPKEGDELRVKKVRNYLKTITGFAQITLIEREENGRVTNNRGGMRQVLDEYGKLIFLEDDIITAPGFLEYMNLALNKYANDPKVFSISGYCPPILIPNNYEFDAYFVRRFNAWGFGIWKDRFDTIQYVSEQRYADFINSEDDVRDFTENGGVDMLEMLRVDAAGRIDALDVKAMFAQYKLDQYTLYPVSSLIQNIGMDGSGLHSSRTRRFNVAISEKVDSFLLPASMFTESEIIKEFIKFRRPRLIQKVASLLRLLRENFFQDYTNY